MADIFDKGKRSQVMSRVSRKDTPFEVLVRKFLFAEGFRFRKNFNGLPGTPDIVLPKYKVAIFVHGCFWHGHSCRAGRLPRSNRNFWEQKIIGNKLRDKRKNRQLKTLGWKVIVLWECRLKNKVTLKKTMKRISLIIEGNI